MKHLKLFQTEAEYTAYKNGGDFVLPNVSYTVDTTNVFYNAFEEKASQNVGDIVYYVDGNLETVPYANYNASMGTAVGVVVVPKNFAPDGKARMVSLKFVTSAGTPSDSAVGLMWEPISLQGTDTALTNYNRVPITDNVGSTTTGSNYCGYLPSDKFSATVSMIDPEAKYTSSTPYIPSPYLNGAANPDYYEAIEGYNNALSDFNGLGNTATLVGLGSGYVAANAANNYSDGVSGAKWYLPAMGELGYLMPRFKEINNAIAAAGGVALSSDYFWSSSEYSRYTACMLYTSNGYVYDYGKIDGCVVRPFAIVE